MALLVCAAGGRVKLIWGPVRCSGAARPALLRCPWTPSASSSALALGLPVKLDWGPVQCSGAARPANQPPRGSRRAPRTNPRAAPAARSSSASALGLPLQLRRGPGQPAAARRRRGGAGCLPLAGARRRAGFFAGAISVFAPARSTSSTTESGAASPWRAPSLTTRV